MVEYRGRPVSANIDDRRYSDPAWSEYLNSPMFGRAAWAPPEGNDPQFDEKYKPWFAEQRIANLKQMRIALNPDGSIVVPGNQTHLSSSTKGGMSDPAVIGTIIAEAGPDPKAQAAVAWVIQNRANQTGKTPLEVVKQKGQFEGYENPGYGSKQAKGDPKVRAAAEKVVNDVTSGKIADPTNGGTMFHADSMTPYWAKSADKHGTTNIGGNVFYKGSAKPSSAVAAINEVAPLPAPAPLRASAYAPSVPKVRAITVNPDGTPVVPSAVAPSSRALPDLQSALNAKAAIRAIPPIPQSRPAFAPSQALPSRAQIVAEAGSEQRANRSATPLPSPPTPLISRPVTTVKIDPYTGNPILPPAPRVALNGMNGRGTGVATPYGVNDPQSMFYQPGRPTAQLTSNAPSKDLATLGHTPTQQKVIDGGYYALHPDERPSPPTVPGITAAQRNAIASVGNYQPDIIRNVPPPAPIRTASTINAATPLDGNLLGLSPVAPKPPAVAAIDAVAPTIAPRIAPVPHARPIAAPTVPIPVIPDATRPRAPASIPLSALNTVNPVSQIVPRVQANFNTSPFGHLFQAVTGQPVQGGLLGMLMNNRQAPQAPAPIAPQPVGFNGTNTVRSDELAGGNGSIFTTNTVLPASMNNSRWLTGY